ncbi:MAG: YiiD C-terminal domain-containing protein [Deltaproteobacteria bacterium]|nr:YiiD C-terminal domain-containing protein [Deltaproteobacteria bacterium]
MNADDLRALIAGGIPFLKKVAVQVDEITPTRVRLRLPHDPTNNNYVGITHAGAIFTFGETCAGVAAGAAFDLSRLRMLARRAEIDYLKPVDGEIASTVEITPDTVAGVERAVERDGKAILPLAVMMYNTAGAAVAEMTVEYHFRKLA